MLISTKHIFIIIIIIFLNEVLTMEVDVDIFFRNGKLMLL